MISFILWGESFPSSLSDVANIAHSLCRSLRLFVRYDFVGDATRFQDDWPCRPLGSRHIHSLHDQHRYVWLTSDRTGPILTLSVDAHAVGDLVVFCRAFGTYPGGAELYWIQYVELQQDCWSQVVIE